MITYEENLQIRRKEPKLSNADKTTWNMGNEIPIQWLEEVTANGEYVPKFDGLSTNFGIGVYKDGSISCGFEIEASDPSFLGDEEANVLHTQIEAALGGLLKEEHLQFLWATLDEDEKTLQIFEKEREGLKTNPVQFYIRKTILERDRARLQNGELKSYRCACFLNIPYYETKDDVVTKKEGVVDFLLNGLKAIPKAIDAMGTLLTYPSVELEENYLKSRISLCLEKLKSLMSNFNSCTGITARPLNATEYYRILLRTWSPSHWKIDKFTNGKTLEGPQNTSRLPLTNYFALEDVDDWGYTFKTGNTFHRILSLRVPPEYCDMGYMVGCMVAKENTAIYNSQFSLTLRPSSAARAAMAIQGHMKLMLKQYEGNPKEHINLKPIIDDMEQQLFKLTRADGSHVFKTTAMIHIWHEDSLILDKWEASLMRSFSLPPIKARVSLEEHNSLPFFLGYFTPGYTRCEDDSRDHIYMATEAATHIPLMGSANGYIQDSLENRRAPLLLETHRGTLQLQDDFARGRVNAWSGVAIGTTGSGKSMYYNMKIGQTLSDRDIIVVLDGALADGSFRAMSNLHNGRYIETGLQLGDETFSQNPMLTEEMADGSFRKPNTEELNRITNIIEPMIRIRATQELTEPERTLITGAVNLAFENYKDENGRVYLRNVAKALKDRFKGDNSTQAQRSIEMGQHLEDQWCFPYGTFRYFVDKDSKITKQSNLTVYDLKGLSENPTLKGVMVATYLNQINAIVNENLKKPEHQQARIWVIIDEAWAALQDPVLVTSLQGLYRASRARNISVHCLTQQMADLKKILIAANKATGGTELDTNNNAILGNTNWFNLFKHSPSDIAITKEILNLPTRQAEEIGELGTVSGKSKEMIQYVRLQNGSAFTKLIIKPTPFELRAYSSDAQEKGKKYKNKEKLIKEWSQTESRTNIRKEAVDRLEALGFREAHILRDEQIIEIIATVDSL
jgi:hypothetical protein